MMKLSGTKTYTVEFPKGTNIKDWIIKNATPVKKDYNPDKNDIFLLFLNHSVFYVTYLGKGKTIFKKFVAYIDSVNKEEEKVKRPKSVRTKGRVFLITRPDELENLTIRPFAL